jgi:hypothetical protein
MSHQGAEKGAEISFADSTTREIIAPNPIGNPQGWVARSTPLL